MEYRPRQLGAGAGTKHADVVRDSWDRADRTYSTYENTDRYFASRFDNATYRAGDDSFEDYRPAYRYGTQTPYTLIDDRDWDDKLEGELKEGWEKVKGNSKPVLGARQGRGEGCLRFRALRQPHTSGAVNRSSWPSGNPW